MITTEWCRDQPGMQQVKVISKDGIKWSWLDTERGIEEIPSDLFRMVQLIGVTPAGTWLGRIVFDPANLPTS